MYVIGTAGHVDHGKSLLVEALTGIDPDRLREEKTRGMTWFGCAMFVEHPIVVVPVAVLQLHIWLLDARTNLHAFIYPPWIYPKTVIGDHHSLNGLIVPNDSHKDLLGLRID